MMVQLMLFRQLKIADPVSPKELYEYFTANEDSFASPEKVVLAMLKLDSSRPAFADEVVSVGEMLKKNPEKFAGLVKIYSPELGSGELGEIERKQLRPEFSAAFKEFVPGMVVGPVKVYGGAVWLKVVSHTPAKKVSFHDVEARLRLEMERKRREKVIKNYAGKLRAEALIEYYF
jgi:parvulin-like peptidyl-prolyl isomerase